MYLNFSKDIAIVFPMQPKLAMMKRESRADHPLARLEEEDRDFIVQFVLASGSLKEMAELHQVSYPTIRIVLDRVIDNLKNVMNGVAVDPMTTLLADLVERGEIKVGAAKSIRAAHRDALRRFEKGE